MEQMPARLRDVDVLADQVAVDRGDESSGLKSRSSTFAFSFAAM
jgi:hypothetical protein